ncbi:MAG: PQQ-binding-like beta-propeller repeat protein [Chloroflexota bacterium]
MWTPELIPSLDPVMDEGIVLISGSENQIEYTNVFQNDPSADASADWADYGPCVIVQGSFEVDPSNPISYGRQTFCSGIGLVEELRFDDNDQLIERSRIVSSNLVDFGESPIAQWPNDFTEPISDDALLDTDFPNQVLNFITAYPPFGSVSSPIQPITVVSADDQLMVSAKLSGNLTALSAVNGGFVWDFPAPKPIFGSLSRNPQNGLIYLGGQDGQLYAINQYGMFIDAIALGDRAVTRPVFGDDVVWVGTEGGSVYCVSADFETRQSTLINAGEPVAAYPVLFEGYAIFGGDSGIVFSVDADCEIVWEFEAGNPIEAPLTIDESGLVYFADTAQIGALNAKTGEEIWSRESSNPIRLQPIIQNDTLYYVDEFQLLFSLEKDTGRLKWSNGDFNFSSQPVIANDLLFLNAAPNQLVALNFDGELQYEWSLDEVDLPEFFEAGELMFSPVIANNLLWVFDSNGSLYLLLSPIQ